MRVAGELEMAAGGDWNWSDLSGVGSFGAFLALIGGWLHMAGKKDRSVEDIDAKATRAADDASRVARDLAEYKVAAAERFVPREHLEAMENKILLRMDKQDERFDKSMATLVERIDRIFQPKNNP